MTAVSYFLAKLQSSALWDLRKNDAIGILSFVTEKHAKELPDTGQAMHLKVGEIAIFLNINKILELQEAGVTDPCVS